MPTVMIDFYKGRTLDQKRAMVKKVTEALVETSSPHHSSRNFS